jgi:hypothetical protein
MGKYGQAALYTVELMTSNKMNELVDAWNKATIEIFGEGRASQKKGCPRSAFIGLCDAGLVKGVKEGTYSKKSDSKNKYYAISAVNLIKEDPSLADDINLLWSKVICGEEKVQNSQMDIVVSLWKNGLIV